MEEICVWVSSMPYTYQLGRKAKNLLLDVSHFHTLLIHNYVLIRFKCSNLNKVSMWNHYFLFCKYWKCVKYTILSFPIAQHHHDTLHCVIDSKEKLKLSIEAVTHLPIWFAHWWLLFSPHYKSHDSKALFSPEGFVVWQLSTWVFLYGFLSYLS